MDAHVRWVRRFRPSIEVGSWTCGRCGRPHPVADSYLVGHQHHDRTPEMTMVAHVCADCAAALEPRAPTD